MSKKLSLRRMRTQQLTVTKKIRRWNDYVKKRNRLRNLPKFGISHKNKEENYKAVELPSIFCVDEIDVALQFLNRIIRLVNHDKSLRHIFFDLKKLKKIDYVGLCLMLSLANRFVGNRITTAGNYPDAPESRRFILESGFCNLVMTNVRKPIKNLPGNILYMFGSHEVKNERIGKIIKDAIYQLTGVNEHYPPVYENILEICANSVEHANKDVILKNWLVSISFENNHALFVLTDTGEGILRTLRKKKSQLFVDSISFKKDGNVIKDVFNNKYQSITGEINRHKGLPNVLNSFMNGYISELMVITNSVMYDFASESFTTLKNELKGTVYTWKLSTTNIKKYYNEN